MNKNWETLSLTLGVPLQDCLVVRHTLFFIKDFSPELQFNSESELFFALFLVHLLQLERFNILFSDINSLERDLFYWLDTDNAQHKQFSQVFLKMRDYLFQYKKIVSDDLELCSPIIHENKKFVYLRKNYFLQQEFLEILQKRFLSRVNETYFPDLILSNKENLEIVKSLNTNLEISPELFQALEIIHQRDFLILIGDPGTGKTTALSVILRTLLSKTHLTQRVPKLKIILTAPTGRAKDRIIENFQNILTKSDLKSFEEIPSQAFTLHSLLNYQADYITQFPPPLLCADIIVVDEMSMVDIRLFIRLLQSLPQKCKLILIGDPNQLPSIEPGSVFRDMLQDSLSDPSHLLNPFTIKLLKNHRFSQSPVLCNFVMNFFKNSLDNIKQYMGSANKIFNSEIHIVNLDQTTLPQLLVTLKSLYTFDYHPDSFEKWHNELSYTTDQQSAQIDKMLKVFEDTCILSARRKNDPLSADELNFRFVSPKGSFRKLSHGTPVIVTKNLNHLKLTNGERGVIIQRKSQLVAYFRGRGKSVWKSIPISLIANFLEPSYVTTIHKGQGSEFKNVCIILPIHHQDVLITRSLFFTAITRAKYKLTLCTTSDTLSYILSYQETIESSKIGKFFTQTQDKNSSINQDKKSRKILFFDS